MNAPWILTGCLDSGLLYSMSPRPRSFSAPVWSMMMRLFVELDTANAICVGMLLLIIPVMTSDDGLWVASIRWIPQNLATAVMRLIDVSSSLPTASIRSANSSMMTMMYGSLTLASFFSSIFSLYSSIFLAPMLENRAIRLSISSTTKLMALRAFLASVMTGVSRCGMPLYSDSSTILGSTRIILTSLGVLV